MKLNENTIYLGNCLEVMQDFLDESVNCVVTSPPYWGLRDYNLDPLIWDSDNGCLHEWGDLIQVDTRKCNVGKKRWNHNPKPDDKIPQHIKANQGNICNKMWCLAWFAWIGANAGVVCKAHSRYFQ